MAAKHAIFIGYRREDSADTAGRIYDRLEQRFGQDHVFKDVDSIPVGADFRTYVGGVVKECRVFMPLIGPGWLNAKHHDGSRRLDDPDDLVRIEIETALNTPGLQVVPVLLGGASMPSPADLPASIRKLAGINAAQVRRDPDFRGDMERLVRELAPLLSVKQRPHIEEDARPSSNGGSVAVTLFVLGAVAAGAGGFVLYQRGSPAPAEVASATLSTVPPPAAPPAQSQVAVSPSSNPQPRQRADVVNPAVTSSPKPTLSAARSAAAPSVASVAPVTPPQPDVIVQPKWIVPPDPSLVSRYFPDFARRSEQNGRVTLQCAVAASGAVSCTVLSESPPDFGFGAAALKMVPGFKISPKTVNGTPVDGGVVRVPISFSLY